LHGIAVLLMQRRSARVRLRVVSPETRLRVSTHTGFFALLMQRRSARVRLRGFAPENGWNHKATKRLAVS